MIFRTDSPIWRTGVAITLAGLLGACTGGNGLLGPAGAGAATDAVDAGSSGGATSVLSSTTDECGIPASDEEMAERVVGLVNAERIKRGLAPIRLNLKLIEVAEGYACRHIEADFYELLGGPDGGGLAHVDPITGDGPGERALDGGYLFISLGENLAGGQRTPEEVVTDWMASSGHRQNILAPQWRETGVGVRSGGFFGVYWVQVFGDPP